VFSFEPRCQGACGSQNQMSIFNRRASSGVAGHLGAAIVGHALAHRRGQALHLPGEAVERRLGADVPHLAENDEARLALDQRAHRRPVEGALEQIAFPVAGDEARLDLLGPVDNSQLFRNDSAACPRGAPAAARRFGLAQGLNHRRFQPAARLRAPHRSSRG
jgi:hypothetical protein